MQCRFCQSSKTKKYGHTPKGMQRHRCNDCGKAFVEVMDPRRMTPAEHAHAQRLFEEGLSGRAVARALSRGVSTIWVFLKKSENAPDNGSLKSLPACG